MKTNRLLVFTVFAVIACILAIGSVSAANSTYNYTGPANSSSVYQADNQHTGQSNYTGPQTNTTKWIDTSSGNSVRIAIGSDGTIYTGGNSKPLRAFAPNGTEKWSYTPPHQTIIGIAVGNNETIYLTISTGLVALYSNGTEKWFYNANSQDSCSFGAGSYPVISSDGTIYVGGYTTTQTGLLYAFDPNGNVKWGFSVPGGVTGAGIRGSPTIGHDGTVYVASGSALTFNGTLYALDPVEFALNPTTATPKWTYTLPSGNLNGISPVVGPDGTIYLLSGTSSTGIVYAVNQNGTLKWSYNIGTSTSLCGLAIASNGTIYVASGTSLYAFDPADGTPIVLYSSFPSNAQQIVPVVGADGTIYVGSAGSSGKMYAFYPDGTIKWTYNTAGSTQGPIVIAADGTLYFSTYSTSRIFAIQDLIGSFTTSASGLNVQFTDTSSNIPVSWSWDFGDGSTSTEQNPTHTYTHAGKYNVTLTVTLGDIHSTEKKEITVNQAPTIGPIGDKTVKEHDTVSFVVNGSDPDEDPLIYDATGLPTGANFNTTTRAFSWTPTYDQAGTYHITFTVFDGNSISSETVTITVNNVNRAPAIDVSNKTVNEKQTLNFTVAGSDPDNGDKLIYSVTGLPDRSYTLDQNTGAFSWTPTYDQAGTYQVTFTVTDGNLTASKTVNITVNNINRAPTLNPIGNKAVDENKKLTFTVSGSDLDGGNLTYSTTNLPAGATFNTATGAFNWTPTFSQSGSYTITFRVSDGSLTDSKTITITVKDVDNVAPKVSKVDPAKNILTKTAKAIKVTFNESVKLGTKAISLKNSSGKAVAFNRSISGKVLTITPKTALGNGKYTLTLQDGSVTDLAGNALAPFSTAFTVDKVVPTVTKADPVNNAVKVSAGKTIKVTFNEAIQNGSKKIELKNSSNKAIAFTSSISGKVLTIKPKNKLIESKYKLILNTGSIADKAGNLLKAKTISFTVGTPPKVSKIDPKSGATKVARNKIIKVTFNEAIKKGSNFKVDLRTFKGNKLVKVTKSINGKVLTLKHAKLAANTKYKLVLYTGSVTDKAGNPTAAKTYTFTTGKT